MLIEVLILKQKNEQEQGQHESPQKR